MSDRQNKTAVGYQNVGNVVPPHSHDAEIAVLGAMMLDKIAVSKCVERLQPDCFYDEKHRIIFKIMLEMYEAGIEIDILTLDNNIRKRSQIRKSGGTYYLTEINGKTPSAANVEHHAAIVMEKYFKRKLITIGGQLIERGLNEASDAFDEIDFAEHTIFKLAEARFLRQYSKLKDLVHQTYDKVMALKGKTGGLTGIASGFRDIDSLTGGFQNSDLIIIAARPSMGKTALALSIAANIGLKSKLPVAFFSIEMASEQLVIRMMSMESGVNQQHIRNGKINDHDNRRLVTALGKLQNAPIIIDDSPMLSVLEFRAKVRRLKAEQKIRIVIVDYLQLMTAKAEVREREISIISSTLKAIAKEMAIPVIALAQLNRMLETRQDKRPMLSDLRESGSLEQDADVVMFVHRPEVYKREEYDDGTSTAGTAEIIIGKQRNGPIGDVRLAFRKELALFDNLSYHDGEPLPYTGGGYNDDPGYNEPDF